MKDITKKLLNVQRDLKCPKDSFNAFAKYYFRNAESILEAAKPHLAANNLVLNLSDEIVMVGDRIYVKATARLISIDTGEQIEVSAYAREPDDKKGSDQSQITGAASSYARKYSLNGLFCIDDTKDADSTNTFGKDAPAAAQPKDDMPEKIVASFWQQTTLAGLEEKMTKAKGAGYGAHKDVTEAYEELKKKLA